MTIQYRDIPASPEYPMLYIGGERQQIYGGDRCRVATVEGDWSVVDVQGGARGVRVPTRDVVAPESVFGPGGFRE